MYAHFDAVAFAFGHAAEHGHDQVVGFVVAVDGTADFGHPERYLVVHEEGEGVTELVAVEGALRLTDDHRVESTVAVGECGQEGLGAGTPFPRKGAGFSDVEVVGHDRASGRREEGFSPTALP
ncbi:hypothetical protein AN217_19620 [Streptomyces qinglanensis]|uniref:Uncharacterized protein n=1 Tax=Streptomyces qinglanensis TaxID=943816 RepID=A0A1E7K6T6_9ACTN|nr:hypothetical protein AN217_19620 [Streptomyces qinglanensis]OEV25266.1 hypothetical protein AN220_14665 [Streptomyces nanshensis]